MKLPVEDRTYELTLPHLEPNAEYEICLNGITSSATGTGNYNCRFITTQEEQQQVALVLVNHDVEESAQSLIEQWRTLIEASNPNLHLVIETVSADTLAASLHTQIVAAYETQNVKTAVLIGYDLPYMTTKLYESPIPFLMAYSNMYPEDTQDWYNNASASANDIVIAAISPKDSSITNYFQRLVSYYSGELSFSKQALLADAMIEAEKGLPNLVPLLSDYTVSEVTGITDYGNIAEANDWQIDFYQKLQAQSYDLIFIDAHGSTATHSPCGTECVNSASIRNLTVSSKLFVVVSCSVGRIMATDPLIASYVFETESLAGLASELLFWDVNGQASSTVFRRLSDLDYSIGEAGRSMGLITVGDPFLKLSD
jgi:hypothetical protein